VERLHQGASCFWLRSVRFVDHVLQAHPDAKPFRDAPFPLYDELSLLCEGIIATGVNAVGTGRRSRRGGRTTAAIELMDDIAGAVTADFAPSRMDRAPSPDVAPPTPDVAPPTPDVAPPPLGAQTTPLKVRIVLCAWHDVIDQLATSASALFVVTIARIPPRPPSGSVRPMPPR
jgi:hypothetical protein